MSNALHAGRNQAHDLFSGMNIWEQVRTPDPSYTRKIPPANRMTTIDAQYQIQRMTELFGPVGHGWGYEVHGEVLGTYGDPSTDPVFQAVVSVWTGSRANSYGPIYALHPLYERAKGQVRPDYDAPKKAITDALTKALSHLGMAADVYLGRFDDNRYVALATEAFSQERDVPSASPVVRVSRGTDGVTRVPLNAQKEDGAAKAASAAAVEEWWSRDSLLIPVRANDDGTNNWDQWADRFCRAARAAPTSILLERLMDDNCRLFDRLGHENVGLYDTATHALMRAQDAFADPA